MRLLRGAVRSDEVDAGKGLGVGIGVFLRQKPLEENADRHSVLGAATGVRLPPKVAPPEVVPPKAAPKTASASSGAVSWLGACPSSSSFGGHCRNPANPLRTGQQHTPSPEMRLRFHYLLLAGQRKPLSPRPGTCDHPRKKQSPRIFRPPPNSRFSQRPPLEQGACSQSPPVSIRLPFAADSEHWIPSQRTSDGLPAPKSARTATSVPPLPPAHRPSPE